MLTLLVSLAFAAPAGHFHPDDVGAASSLMVEASQSLSTTFEARSTALRKVAGALRAYREGLELLGPRAPQPAWDRLAALEKRYHREEAVLQTFADEVVADFDAAMQAGLGRATAKWGELQRCRAELEVGPRVPGMRGRTEPNPECEGPNRNAAIAEAMDGDGALRASVAEVVAREWPDVTLEEEPQPSIGTAEGWVELRRLVSARSKDALRAIDRADDELRMEIEAALEQPDPDLEALKARVAEIEAVTAAARGELGARVIAAAESRAPKKAGGPVAWCANPEVLGACVGPDRTAEVVPALMGDRKFVKLTRE